MPTLLFDLDGTLVDTLPDLAAGLNRLMAARQLAPFPLPEVASYVGDGAGALVRRAFEARRTPQDDAALADFLADHTKHVADASRAYPGVADMLDTLAANRWRMAVSTNKPEAASRALLEALGLLHHFAALGGGDSFPVRKPDPRHLQATLAAAGGETSRAVMVGDHANDVRAARAAGVPCIFAAWGFGPGTMAEGAQATAQQPTDVPDLATLLLG